MRPKQRGVGAEGLGAGDLLLEHRRHQRLEHATGARKPEAGVPTLELAHDRVVSHQPLRLIVLADQGGNLVEQAPRAVSPRLGLDRRAA